MNVRIPLVIGICAVCATVLSSCPAESAAAPERIYSKRIRYFSTERYKELRDEWKAWAETHPGDPMGWTEFAKAARYAGEPCEAYLGYAKKAIEFDPSYAEAHAVLGGSNWRQYCPSAPEDPSNAIRELEKALELDPASRDPHYMLWPMKLYQGKTDEAAGHLKSLIRGGDFPEFLLDLAYNMLVAVEPNAIILTNGDNDTYPPLALQAARGIRPDVAIVNLSLLNTVWYRKLMMEGPLAIPLPAIDEDAPGPQAGAAVMGLQEKLAGAGWTRPLYVAVTVHRPSLPLPNRLSLEGVVYRVLPEQGSEAEVDVEKLAENLGKNYRLESATALGFDWNHFSSLPNLVVNYAAAYSHLASGLAEKGDLDGARGAFREALRLMEFHSKADFGKGIAEEWRKIDAESKEPEEWIARFSK